MIDARDGVEGPVAEALTIVGGEQHAGFGHKTWRKRQIFIWSEYQVIGDRDIGAERIGTAGRGYKEPAGALYRGIGSGKVGRVENGPAVDLHCRIAKLD